MDPEDADVIASIQNYQGRLERYVAHQNTDKVMYVIKKLRLLPIRTIHLESTGVGRTVNGLKKLGGEVSEESKNLVASWKDMVLQEENARAVPDADNDEEMSVDSAVESAAESDLSTDEENNYEKPVYVGKEDLQNGEYIEKTSFSNKLSRNEEKSDEKIDIYQSTSRSTDRRTESSSRERESKKKENHSNKHKLEIEHRSENKPEKHSYNRIGDDSSASSDSELEKNKKRKTESKRRHDSSSSDREDKKRKSRKHKHDRESEEKKHKTKHSRDEKESSRSKSRDKTGSSSGKSDKDSHKRSDSSKSKKSSGCDDKKVDSKRKLEKSKHSSSSSEEPKKEKESKSTSHVSRSEGDKKEKDSRKEKEKSHNRKSEDKHKSRKDSKKKEDKSEDRSSSRHKSEIKSKEKKENHVKSESKGKILNGIDSESGASFAEALGMCAPIVVTKSFKKKTSTPSSSEKPKSISINPEKPSSSFEMPSSSFEMPEHEEMEVEEYVPELLKQKPQLEPLNINISSLLPEITPNYRPLGVSRLEDLHPKRALTDDEALSRLMTNKNQRTKVYSGNKSYGKVETLFDLCVRVLQDNIDAFEYTGGVPYSILKPVLERASPDQLFNLEHHNPYLIEDTDYLWQLHCQKTFRTKKREELESWREMYMRCLDEREAKLSFITANIKQSQDKSVPVRTTKLAYIDSVVKPPRNILRKQVKNGIMMDRKPSPSAKLVAIASSGEAGKIAVPNPGGKSSEKSHSGSASAFKPKRPR